MPHDVTDPSDIPDVLTGELREMLGSVGTATITAQLFRRGIRSTFLSGLKPLLADQRMVGRARTLRYVAVREDVLNAGGPRIGSQRHASETIDAGDVLIMEARQIPDAGTVGDIYAARAYHRGAVGIVTDGALRDTAGIAALGRPVYHQSSHGSTWRRHHMPYSCDEPITCAGVYVEPGDVVVGDAEGAVVIPHALVDEVARDCVAQEEREAFAAERVRAGESTHGIFPLSDERRPDFEAWRAARQSGN
ncbi:MAG: hypothetical protein OES24_13080 [Acidimicrobiia bacterium]|nr:hypothetical protein [Acidimicrobiia bacterium]